MQFRAFERDIEVNGQTVYSIIDGFNIFKKIPSDILLAEGIGERGTDGFVFITPDAWYSQEAWLRAFEKIADKAGATVLYQIGRRIPKNAIFPPGVTDVVSAVASVDIAYHMNHRKNGKILFNPATGQMMEGIGHYGCEAVPGERKLISRCHNPYPCDFDRGIITTVAKRFGELVMVVHDEAQPCRKKGADSCTYVVTW